jgi:cytochrome P450
MTLTADFQPGTAPTSTGDGRDLLAWLAQMRQHYPVWRDEQTGAVHVFRHEDVVRVLGDPATFSSEFGALAPAREDDAPNFIDGTLTVTDPPRHHQLRRLVSQAFTPRAIALLEPRIAEVTNELLDEVGGADRFDLVAQLTYPLPVSVIAELLGIPTSDRSLFRHWAELLMSSTYGTAAGTLPDAPIPESTAEGLRQMRDYLLEHADHRRRHARDDVLGRLVTAEVDGRRLTEAEVLNFSVLLLLAGHLTTTLLLGNAVLCLDEYPQTVTAMRADRSLIPGAIEEVLRYRPPVVFLYRLARNPVRIGEVDVPAGSIVVNWLLSANRDERQFVDAHRFDPRRQVPHLTLGHGIHFCLGAPLARLESRIALNLLLDRYCDVRVAPGDAPTFHESVDIFGVRKLPVSVRPATDANATA